ncbi:MAG: GspE/PulE family protein [Pseudomonadota bacterium]
MVATNDLEDPTAMMIGEILVQRGLLSGADLARGLAVQREIGGLLGQTLHRIGSVSEESLLACLAAQLRMDVLTNADVPAVAAPFLDALRTLDLPAAWFKARRAAVWFEPQKTGEDGLTNGAAHPAQTDAASETASPPQSQINVVATDALCPVLREGVESAIRRAVAAGRVGGNAALRYFLAENQLVDSCLAQYDEQKSADDVSDADDAARLRELAEEAPIIDFVNNVITNALKENASDIHVEAYLPACVVRYRIDGVLHEKSSFARARFDAVASRIKLIAGMDIAERRLPQDGRSSVRFAGKEVDLRVSSVPSTWGESIVIRLLRKQTELPDFEGLGLFGRTQEVFHRIISMPNGVFLVTGPTGSGKSTTLYRGLEFINDGERKIVTIEDPVEYDIPGVTQIQTKSEIGYTFANGLRAVLRQDPDVIMVGEIRDGETATIAAQSALTGHFVLSTLHTNSALASVTRLKDIGLEPYLIAASVRGLMAQRLVRRLCDACAEPESEKNVSALLKKSEAAESGFLKRHERKPANWRRPVGCDKCSGTGYRGRIALAEVVEIDNPMRRAITEEAPADELLKICREQGFLTLFEDGILKARGGLTTLAEVLRVCSGDYV